MRNILILFLLISVSIVAQDLEEYYNKIDSKITLDNDYLDIYTINWAPQNIEELSNFKGLVNRYGEKIPFAVNDRIEYKFYFIKETIEVKELTLLKVERITAPQTSGGFLPTKNLEPKIEEIYGFGDFNELYFSDKQKYDGIKALVENLIRENNPNSELDIDFEDEESTKGYTSHNNQDYLDYEWINGRHTYPKNPNASSKKRLSRRERAQLSSGSEIRIDATPYSVSFFHKEMDFDFSMLSAELSFDSDLMNIHPYQTNAMKIGFRSLIFLSQDKKQIINDFVVDLRLMGRIGMNTSSIVEYLPFVFVEDSKLNIGSGFIMDVRTTRIFDIPFLNLYFAMGAENVENPSISFGESDSSYAYFSFGEYKATMSFFWNTSRAKNLRFRMDVGFGGYDIVKAIYQRGRTSSKTIFNSVLPLINLSMNYVQTGKSGNKNNELFAANIRFFDNIVKSDFWLKLVELKGGLHTFRFEVGFISNPLYRPAYEWETIGSTKIGLRYRYGFN